MGLGSHVFLQVNLHTVWRHRTLSPVNWPASMRLRRAHLLDAHQCNSIGNWSSASTPAAVSRTIRSVRRPPTFGTVIVDLSVNTMFSLSTVVLPGPIHGASSSGSMPVPCPVPWPRASLEYCSYPDLTSACWITV